MPIQHVKDLPPTIVKQIEEAFYFRATHVTAGACEDLASGLEKLANGAFDPGEVTSELKPGVLYAAQQVRLFAKTIKYDDTPIAKTLEHAAALRKADRLICAQLEAAFGLLANAYEGNWSKADPTWREAAERWRAAWVEVLPGGKSLEQIVAAKAAE